MYQCFVAQIPKLLGVLIFIIIRQEQKYIRQRWTVNRVQLTTFWVQWTTFWVQSVFFSFLIFVHPRENGT